MTAIDLNCDMGESFAAWTMPGDDEMLDVITSANIACGFHAGDPMVMHRTLIRAKERGVRAGAHPSFHDLVGFGRREMPFESPSDVEKQVIYQIGALQGMARAVGVELQHVKAHGALGNALNVNEDLARAVVRAVKAVAPELAMMVMPGGKLETIAEAEGLRIGREIFADRAYNEDATLVSRRLPGAVLHDAKEAAERVLRMLEKQAIETISGNWIPVKIDTVCVHGDTPGAAEMARELRKTLVAAGVEIKSLAEILAA